MAIKKLFLNYQVSISELLLNYQKEMEKVHIQGDVYFQQKLDFVLSRLLPSAKTIGQEKPTLITIKAYFETYNECVNKLKNFLEENYHISQTEPVFLDIWHGWYIKQKGVVFKGLYLFSPKILGEAEKGEHLWLYQDVVYGIDGLFTSEEEKLLLLDYCDQERRKFERLKKKFAGENSDAIKYVRERIPEEVRIVVWRRDQGRCAKCGSRENLEYDHIVPVSKGGSNTVRNIELLCQNCNRAKSNNIE